MRYQSNRPKRQFLAGVVCTACKSQDTTVQIQIFEPDYDEYIECISCHHQERRPKPEDLNTQSEQGADEVGVVRFL
ncbi:MAG: YheV family putative metal-binding protein [Moraxella sp.]|nr:YheV family putative metal-binding protein [Moraxella sp.]